MLADLSTLKELLDAIEHSESPQTVSEQNAFLYSLQQLEGRVDALVQQSRTENEQGWRGGRRVVPDEETGSEDQDPASDLSESSQLAPFEPQYMDSCGPVAGPTRGTGSGLKYKMVLKRDGQADQEIFTKAAAAKAIGKHSTFLSGISFLPGMYLWFPGGVLQFPEPSGWRDDVLYVPPMPLESRWWSPPLALSRQTPGLFFTWKKDDSTATGTLMGPSTPCYERGRVKITVWCKRTSHLVGFMWARAYAYGLIMTQDEGSRHMTCADRVRADPSSWTEYEVCAQHQLDECMYQPVNDSSQL